MKTYDEIKLCLEDARRSYPAPIIKAIGRANLSVEDLSYIVGVSEGTLYRILGGRERVWPELIADLSVVLDAPVGELFPEVEGQDD